MTIGKIVVLSRIHHQCIDCGFSLAETGGSHCGHRAVPSPRSFPLPLVDDTGQGATHCFSGSTPFWQDAQRTEHRGMVIVALRESLRAIFVCQIYAVADREPRKPSYCIIPLRVSRKARPLQPSLSNQQAPAPVCQLERWIPRV